MQGSSLVRGSTIVTVRRVITAMAVLMMLVGAILTMMVGGCGRRAGVVFEPLPAPLVWPAAPERPRVQYLGQLATNEDLKPAKSFMDLTRETFFGKKTRYRMVSPYALCTDDKQRLFVADSNAQVVHVFDLEKHEYQQWRPGVGKKRKTARFAQPVGIAYDPAGRLIVADSVVGALFVFDDQGRYQGLLGEDHLQRPCGVAIDPTTRRVFVADVAAHQVVVLSPEGELIKRVGQRGVELGQFNYPTNVAVDRRGWLYVSDSLNFRIQQFDADLNPVRQIGSKGDLPGYFSQPKGIAVDRENNLYVVDAHFEAVQIFDAQGRLLLNFGEEGRRPGQFWLPAGIYIDAQDRIWIADTYNGRVQVFKHLTKAAP